MHIIHLYGEDDIYTAVDLLALHASEQMAASGLLAYDYHAKLDHSHAFRFRYLPVFVAHLDAGGPATFYCPLLLPNQKARWKTLDHVPMIGAVRRATPGFDYPTVINNVKDLANAWFLGDPSPEVIKAHLDTNGTYPWMPYEEPAAKGGPVESKTYAIGELEVERWIPSSGPISISITPGPVDPEEIKRRIGEAFRAIAKEPEGTGTDLAKAFHDMMEKRDRSGLTKAERIARSKRKGK